MKNKIKNLLVVIILALVPVLSALAQPSPPAPDPSTSPVNGAPIMNCTVPVGEGYWILLSLAVCYGIYYFWQVKREKKLA